MEIFVESRRRKRENVLKLHPGAEIIDVTSNSDSEFRQLSPFFPIGNIPVPGMEGENALCVEGVWQGLKVFENYNYDKSYFKISTKNIKRTFRKFGVVKGHFYKGELLSYVDARKKIYLPAYKYVLEVKKKQLVDKLRIIANNKTLVLLDYTTNDSILNPSKPLSHAAVIKAAILQDYSILEKVAEIKKEVKQGELF
jgi:hypothetical protein